MKEVLFLLVVLALGLAGLVRSWQRSRLWATSGFAVLTLACAALLLLAFLMSEG